MLVVIMASAHQCWELTSEQKIYAKTHLNETDDIRKDALTKIKRWIEESSDLCAQTDDISILPYLRICKFDIEETKIRIQNYHKFRSDVPEWYTNKDPFQPELQAIFDLRMFFFLRKPDNQGRSVIFTRPCLYDPKTTKLSDLIKIGIMMWDIRLRNHVETSIYGYVLYMDLSGLSLDHITAFGPRVMINLIHLWQKYPANFVTINFINTPGFADATLSLFKTFMNEDLKKKIHSFRTTEGSFNDIPANILPNEYGGSGGPVQELTDYWRKLIEENRDWFIDDEKYKMTVDRSAEIK
ncbi:hypothetical protein P5V15_005837 [Pogonomyrmex californicus]